MQVEIHEKEHAINGSIHLPENYDQGNGLYHFHRESILVLWEDNIAKGPIYTSLGKEPYHQPPTPLKPGQNPLIKF